MFPVIFGFFILNFLINFSNKSLAFSKEPKNKHRLNYTLVEGKIMIWFINKILLKKKFKRNGK